MKLFNKRTGEIAIFGEGIVDLRKIGCANVAEMIEAGWEDYEEPKEYWMIDTCEGWEICRAEEGFGMTDRENKEIGNYFETKEEAEKAVEKLKAWKRIKDKGFEFDGWKYYDEDYIKFKVKNKDLRDVEKDLDLIFGGEDE